MRDHYTTIHVGLVSYLTSRTQYYGFVKILNTTALTVQGTNYPCFQAFYKHLIMERTCYGAHARPKFALGTLRVSFLYEGGFMYVSSSFPDTNQTWWARPNCFIVRWWDETTCWTCTYRGSGWGGAVDSRGRQWFTSLEYVNGRSRPGASQTDIARAAVIVCHGFWRGV